MTGPADASRHVVDDSVAHSWKTTVIEVEPGRVEQIDSGIAPLMQALLRVPGVRTYASCEGHQHSHYDRRAYVNLSLDGVDIEVRIQPDQITALTSVIEQRHQRNATLRDALVGLLELHEDEPDRPAVRVAHAALRTS